MTDIRLPKVEILIQQKKYNEAEKILKDLLSGDANNIYYLSMLAEVYLQQDKFDIAGTITDNAIGISPDSPHLFYMKARIAIQQDKYDDAELHISQAINLDPFDADYFAMHGNIRLARKDYAEALKLADSALEIDPENLLALNTRSTALLKLNKKEESFSTIEGALREDPNNAYTHANYGWGLLEKGDHKKALEHFREALKNDPHFEYAQSGMIEALKAKNPLYRLFLQYSFWIGNLTSKYQWGVIVGFYIVVRILRIVAQANEGLQPFLIPLIIILSLLAFSTWVINPISNLFLRFNTYGNFLLDKNEKRNANFVGASLLILLTGLTLYFVRKEELFLGVAVFGFAMMVPFSNMFSSSKNKIVFLLYPVLMAAAGISALSIAFSTGELFNMMTSIFLIGFIAYQWLSNYLLIKENNR